MRAVADAQHNRQPSWSRGCSVPWGTLGAPARLAQGLRSPGRAVRGVWAQRGLREGELGWIRASPSSPRPLPQIHFWEEQRQNESARVKTLFLPETGVKLKNLTGYTSYWVSVAAFNAAGDGPRSPPVKARTQQAGGARGTAPPAPPAAGLPGEVSPWVRLQGFPVILRSQANIPGLTPAGLWGGGTRG